MVGTPNTDQQFKLVHFTIHKTLLKAFYKQAVTTSPGIGKQYKYSLLARPDINGKRFGIGLCLVNRLSCNNALGFSSQLQQLTSRTLGWITHALCLDLGGRGGGNAQSDLVKE